MIHRCPKGHRITHLPCVMCQQELARDFMERAKQAVADSLKGRPKKYQSPPCPDCEAMVKP